MNKKSASASEAATLPHGGLTVKHANLFYLIHTVPALGLSAVRIPGLPITWAPLICYIPLLIALILMLLKTGATTYAVTARTGAEY